MTQPPEHGSVVVVSLKDMYDTLVQLVSRVDLLIAQHSDHGRDIADHEARLRNLERGRWPMQTLGVIASLTAVVVAVVALLRH